jgi:hypothetical protein
MLIEELDIPIINPLRNLLPDLMGTSSLNHIQPRPSILDFRPGTGTHEEGVLHFSLEGILLDVVR